MSKNFLALLHSAVFHEDIKTMFCTILGVELAVKMREKESLESRRMHI